MENETIIELDLDDETLLWLAKEAHKRDITLNQFINDCIRKYTLIEEGQNP